MVQQQPNRPTPFREIDRTPPEMAALILAALDSMARNPEIQRVRAVALDALRPVPGQRLLDAGAGLGEVARGLAAAVAPGGEVVALDFSAAAVSAAAGRHDGSAVRYLTGDVTGLAFPDAAFDGVRCERVLQHLTEPDRAVAELTRVTRAGGRVCLIDTDWESAALDGLPADLVTAVRTHLLARTFEHRADMGRTLRRRLVGAGLADVTAVPVTCCFLDPAAAADVLVMVNPRVPWEAGFLPEELYEPWFAAIEDAGRRGEFLAALTIWVAAGTRPG
ncbi:methyltransferase domain-containing protein [Plantactinospora siamensis]|uniref:Methyltransferase domain-containing protein n=1 Tax=Plantactinospora siamensis TaxID=555372 RepID=A0ABV6NW57_9ACTN